MIQQIVIEAEPPGDAQSMFRLSIDANLIAKGVTAGQAYYLLGEVLRRIVFPGHAETVTSDADDGTSGAGAHYGPRKLERVLVSKAEAETFEE
jgi:hypothetical protein